jgi:hypothetical protein
MAAYLFILRFLPDFPMENHINQKQEATYSPPPDGLSWPGFAIEMAHEGAWQDLS